MLGDGTPRVDGPPTGDVVDVAPKGALGASCRAGVRAVMACLLPASQLGIFRPWGLHSRCSCPTKAGTQRTIVGALQADHGSVGLSSVRGAFSVHPAAAPSYREWPRPGLATGVVGCFAFS